MSTSHTGPGTLTNGGGAFQRTVNITAAQAEAIIANPAGFYFNMANNTALDAPANPGSFTVFGQVVAGRNALDELGAIPVNPQGGFNQLPLDDDFDGDFHYCRVAYRSNRSGIGGGWATDYPDADANLSIRLAELTKTRVSRHPSGQPNHLIVRLTDDELFQCPFVMMQEVGALYIAEEEAARFRQYFLKGGFLWVDDFWGSYAWNVWASEIAKVLRHPARVVGFHFFNPAPVMKLIELVRTVVTDENVVDVARGFAETIGKSPVVVGDRRGFIANQLLFPYLN